MVMLFNDEETVALPEGVHLEHISVMTVRARGSKASWKVLAGDQIIGRLEASSDMSERIELILRAWHDPESCTPHSPW